MKVFKSISIVGGLLCSTLTMATESNLILLNGGVAAPGEVTGEAVLQGSEGGDAAFGVSMSVTVGQPLITVRNSDGSSTPQNNDCSMDLGFWSYRLQKAAPAAVLETVPEASPAEISITVLPDINDPPITNTEQFGMKMRIYRDGNSQPMSQNGFIIQHGEPFINDELSPGTDYVYDIKGFNAFGYGDAAQIIGATSSAGEVTGVVKTTLQTKVSGVRVKAKNISVPEDLGDGSTLFFDGTSDYLSVGHYDELSLMGERDYENVIVTNPENPSQNFVYSGEHDGHHYLTSKFQSSWLNAASTASEMGGYLISITSEEENNWAASNRDGLDNTWLGCSDATIEGQWAWESGEEFSYTNWAIGEGDNGTSQNYGVFWNPNWNDHWTAEDNGDNRFQVEFDEMPQWLNAALNPGLTIELWVRPTSGAAGDEQVILSKGSDYDLRLNSSRSVVFSTFGESITTESFLTFDDWHHIGIRRTEEGDVSLYINGELEITGTTASGTPSEADLYIGGTPDGSYLRGNVDEIRFWNRYRSEEEFMMDVSAHRSYRKDGEVIDPSLVAFFDFDRGEGALAVNKTGNSPAYFMPGTNEDPGPVWNQYSAPVWIMDYTNSDGQYALKNIPYEQETGTTFRVYPDKAYHEFDNEYLTATLNQYGPTAHGLNFSVINMMTVSGYVYHDTTLTSGGPHIPLVHAEIEVSQMGSDGNWSDYGHHPLGPGFTNDDGYYNLEFEPGATIRVRPAYPGRIFAAPVYQEYLNLVAPKQKDWHDTVTRTLRGTVVGGDCDIPLGTCDGAAMVHLTSSLGEMYIDEGYPIDGLGGYVFHNLPPAEYSLWVEFPCDPPISEFFANNGLAIDLMDSFVADSIQYDEYGGFVEDPPESGILLNGFTTLEDTLVFKYRAPLNTSIDVSSLNTEMCLDGGPDNYPVIQQFEEEQLTLNVYEVYNGEECPVETGTLTIRDYITWDSMAEDSARTITFTGGEYEYTMTGGRPNLSGAGDFPYQKKIEITATDEFERIATDQEWIYSFGSRPRQMDFTTTAPQVPLLIIHDPPGDGSYAFLEQGNELCTSVSFSRESIGEVSAYATVMLGPDLSFSAGLGVEVGYEIDATLDFTASSSFSMSRETGSEQEYCFSTTELWATNDEETGLIGEMSDIFIGGALNLRFGIIDILAYDEDNCEIAQTQDITIAPGDFATKYMFTKAHIVNNVIPQLELIGEFDDIAQWNNILTQNDQNIASAAPMSDETLTLAAGVSYDWSQTTSSSSTTSSSFSIDVSSELEMIAGIEVAGVGIETGMSIGFSMNFGSGSSATSENSKTIGYHLYDDDVGSDAFTGDYYDIQVKVDPVYGTPVFEVSAGRSSCPYETWTNADGVGVTIARDIPFLQFESASTVADVLPGQSAVYELLLGNDNPDEERIYTLFMDQSTNPYGAVVKFNGLLGEFTFRIPPNGRQQVVVTVDKGPIAFAYEDLTMYFGSPCETSDLGDLSGGVSASFSAFFAEPCMEAEIFSLGDQWAISKADSGMKQIWITGLDYDEIVFNDETSFNELQLQWREVGSAAWLSNGDHTFEVDTLKTYMSDRPGQQTFPINWDVSTFPDGNYQVRTFAKCLTGLVVHTGEVKTGVIDTEPPMLLGAPSPVDGVLNMDDQIRVEFTEALDPQSIIPGQMSLTCAGCQDGLEDVPIQVTADGNTIVLNIITENNRLMENATLHATVRSVRDIVGNEFYNELLGLSEVQWSFLVDRNPVSWNSADLIIATFLGEGMEVNTSLNNIGASPSSFVLSGYGSTPWPDWLMSNMMQGQLNAGGTQPITLTVAPFINPGRYSQPVMATTTQGEEFLVLDIRSLCPYPDWDVVTGDYSMNVIADLSVLDDPSIDVFDRVGAFMDGQCVGAADIEEVVIDSDGNTGFRAFLSIANPGTGSSTINLRAWDASNCVEYIIEEQTLTFSADGMEGSLSSPYTISATGTQAQSIYTEPGHTWLSFNLENSDDSYTVISLLSDVDPGADGSGSIILDPTSGNFSQWDGSSWSGTLNSSQFDKTHMYIMNNMAEQTLNLEYKGLPVYADQVEISLSSGWNRIGYLPRANLSLDDALINLTSLSDGDIVKSQDEFATYLSGQSWVGSLDRMYPSLGYMIKVTNGQTFNYPAGLIDAPTDAKLIAESTEEALPEIPWNVNHRKFEGSMSIIALISELEYDINDPSDAVIGLIGNEIRGVARPEYVPALEAYRIFMMVHGRSTEHMVDNISFQIYDHDMEYIYDAFEIIPYDENGLVGTLDNPFNLSKNIQRGDKGFIPEDFSVYQNYPNPFNPITNLRYDLPEQAQVTVIVYDQLGREVTQLVNTTQEAGFRSVQWNATNMHGKPVSAGVYLYQIRAGEFVQTRKMVLLK